MAFTVESSISHENYVIVPVAFTVESSISYENYVIVPVAFTVESSISHENYAIVPDFKKKQGNPCFKCIVPQSFHQITFLYMT